MGMKRPTRQTFDPNDWPLLLGLGGSTVHSLDEAQAIHQRGFAKGEPKALRDGFLTSEDRVAEMHAKFPRPTWFHFTARDKREAA